MTTLPPLETLYEAAQGTALPLPPALEALYGPLRLPAHPDQPYVIANFVSTLDGVVALNEPGAKGGGEISGFNQHDRAVMGLLRAIADVVIVGAGTLRSVPNHLWTAQHIYRPLTDAYQQLRGSLGKAEPPLNVIVSARGGIDLSLPVFQSGEVPTLLVTTAAGAERLRAPQLAPSTQITATSSGPMISAQIIMEAVQRMRPHGVFLVEGGPQLIGDFFAEQRLHELFLTLAPQVAGRDSSTERPGLVAGKRFAPEHPLWGRLIGIKRVGSHLFLRYAFEGETFSYTEK